MPIDLKAAREVCAAVTHYDGPFRYDPRGATVLDKDGNEALDVRGWGRLNQTLDYASDEAARVQDRFGEFVAVAMNTLPSALDEIEALRAALGDAIDLLTDRDAVPVMLDENAIVRIQKMRAALGGKS